MIKLQCDKCGKELDYRDFWEGKLGKLEIDMNDKIEVHMIAGKERLLCEKCWREFKEGIKQWEEEWIEESD